MSRSGSCRSIFDGLPIPAEKFHYRTQGGDGGCHMKLLVDPKMMFIWGQIGKVHKRLSGSEAATCGSEGRSPCSGSH